MEASRRVISFIDRHHMQSFSDGKMLGVLIVRMADDILIHPLGNGFGFLAAFSGIAEGKGTLPYFVPPVFDITDPGGYFRNNEAQIVRINNKIDAIENSIGYLSARKEYEDALKLKVHEVEQFRKAIAESKKIRNEKRERLDADSPLWGLLVQESQFEKAELKRLIRKHDSNIASAKEALDIFREEISSLKGRRQAMSDALQQWIFKQYVVMNASGETADIASIFNEQGLTPPGGTGDCAAPKLLQYAFTHGLEPISMGEFWYGAPPASSVRAHGHFYPSCQHKCGPLLGFMLRGLTLEKAGQPEDEELTPAADPSQGNPVPDIIYEDDYIIVTDKPSGMLSEPGRNGESSLAEHLEKHLRNAAGPSRKALTVHRLDMDTSGIIIYAKTAEAQAALQRQFEEGCVHKTYFATLCPPVYTTSPELKPGDKGTISLPLLSAYEERPRQKVETRKGKESITKYEVLSVSPDGETDIIFHPHTGRTHQLRVHSAHQCGLGRPIKGDFLYGGCSHPEDFPLHLRSISITFTHPVTGLSMTLNTN